MAALPAMPAPMTARARARAELTREILETARHHVAEHGAAGLSLRAVARELGMASSAIYRYFASRDELLTVLIIDAYDAVGEAAERAAATSRGDAVERLTAVAVAIRAWAVAHPHDYALLYGSPVPGYRAPEDTVTPAIRVSVAALGVVVDGLAAGQVSTTASSPVPRRVSAAFGRLREAAAPGVPDEVLSRVLVTWTMIFGSISFELFGHFEGMVDDGAAFFAHQVGRAARYAVTGDGVERSSAERDVGC